MMKEIYNFFQRNKKHEINIQEINHEDKEHINLDDNQNKITDKEKLFKLR